MDKLKNHLQSMPGQIRAQGGVPITPEIATELRSLIFGNAGVPMRAEWTQTPFAFGSPKEEFAYGLRSPRNATRGILSVVQGFIVKTLLFGRKTTRTAALTDPLTPTADMQRDALVSALIEILRLIADKGKVVVVLPSPGDECFVDHSALFFHDGVTEKLYLFTLNPNEELEYFIKRHYKIFTEEGGPGTLLFLYCAVLTRTMNKVRSDLDSSKPIPLTMTSNEEGSLMIVTLLLTGRATPYIHNGVVHVGDEGSYAMPQYGVLSRCTIGLLLLENDCGQSSLVMRQPGSRLKTPNYPVWVTVCGGHYGVLFNRNPELLRNYHAESRFELYYYSVSGREIVMTIDNRSYHNQTLGMLERQTSLGECTSISGKPSKEEAAKDEIKDEVIINTPLQKLIHTKWEEAHVRFHGQPSTISYLFSSP